MNFKLACLNRDLNSTVDASVNIGDLMNYTPDVRNPSIVYEVSTQVLRNVFQFSTVLDDTNAPTEPDIRYYVDMTSWPSYYKLNVANGMADYDTNLSPAYQVNSDYQTDNVGVPYPPEKMLMKDIAVRDLANQIFGTPFGVQYFNNEAALTNDIEDQAKMLWEQYIEFQLKYVDTSSNSPGMEADADGNAYATSTISELNYSNGIGDVILGEDYAPSTCANVSNPTKLLLEQIMSTQTGRDRFNTDSLAAPNANGRSGENTIGGTNNRQPLPFIQGDTITFKVTHYHGQNNISSNTSLVSRDYYISLIARDNYWCHDNTPNNRGNGADPDQTILLND
jgi:hypothetical protein